MICHFFVILPVTVIFSGIFLISVIFFLFSVVFLDFRLSLQDSRLPFFGNAFQMNVNRPVGVNHDFVNDVTIETIVPFLTGREGMNVAADILHEFSLVRQQLCAGFFFCQFFLKGELLFIEPLNSFLVLRRFDIARQTHIQQLLLFALDLLQFALEVIDVTLLRTGLQHVAHRAENAF